MSQYKTVKTTMGRKMRVRMSEQEVFERQLFALVIALFPFVSAALMFFIWVKMGG